jgi:hypothetical protein
LKRTIDAAVSFRRWKEGEKCEAKNTTADGLRNDAKAVTALNHNKRGKRSKVSGYTDINTWRVDKSVLACFTY